MTFTFTFIGKAVVDRQDSAAGDGVGTWPIRKVLPETPFKESNMAEQLSTAQHSIVHIHHICFINSVLAGHFGCFDFLA